MQPVAQLRALIIRFIIFSIVFIILSGMVGQWVIGTRLLYGFNFYIYGNLGKLVLFSAIAFLFYAKNAILTVPLKKWSPYNLFYLLFSAVCATAFYFFSKELLAYNSFTQNLSLSLLTHVLLIISSFCLVLAAFGSSYLVSFAKRFKYQLIVSTALAILYDFAIFYVWGYWIYLSTIVLHAEAFLFSFSFSNTTILPPISLFVKDFTVQIEAACSGLDSIFLFTSLYVLIGLFDWKILQKRLYFLLFTPTLLGLFLVNILRVYLLIWVGVLFSPKLTLQLFHTYIGLVLFVIYFLLFMKVVYNKLITK